MVRSHHGPPRFSTSYGVCSTQSNARRYRFGTLRCRKRSVATIVKTPSGSWKVLIRKRGWPTVAKTFRTKRDAEDWSRRTEDSMAQDVRGRPTHYGRPDIVRFLARAPMQALPWKECTFARAASVMLPVLPVQCRAQQCDPAFATGRRHSDARASSERSCRTPVRASSPSPA